MQALSRMRDRCGPPTFDSTTYFSLHAARWHRAGSGTLMPLYWAQFATTNEEGECEHRRAEME